MNIGRIDQEVEDRLAGEFANEWDFRAERYGALIADTLADRLRFVVTGSGSAGPESKAAGYWIVWETDEGRWVRNHTSALRAQTLAQRIATHVVARANQVLANNTYQRRRVHRSMDNPEKLLIAAARQPTLWVSEEDLDADPWLLKVKNGTLDLTKLDDPAGPLRADNPNDLITRLAPVEYDPTATCPMWKESLDRVQPEEVWRDLLQISTGYMLTGATSEAVFWLLEGRTRAGKGVFKNTMLRLLGSYAYECNFDVFLRSHHSSPRSGPDAEMKALMGSRMVFASESSSNDTLNESLVKKITGADTIVVRGLYEKEPIAREATFKVALLSNHPPRISGADEATWERIRRIPWNHTVPREERILDLTDQLVAEHSGILNWALKGLRQWMAHGLPLPAEQVASNLAYREDMDPLGAWIGDALQVTHGDDVAPIKHMYQSYQRWCEQAGESVPTLRAFAKELQAHPMMAATTSCRTRLGAQQYRALRGVRLGTSATPDRTWDAA